jgi:hypothetical protein
MPVRSLVCVYYRGRFAVIKRTIRSCQERDGDGMRALRFLWKPGNIERLREGLEYVVTPTPEGWEQIRKTRARVAIPFVGYRYPLKTIQTNDYV